MPACQALDAVEHRRRHGVIDHVTEHEDPEIFARGILPADEDARNRLPFGEGRELELETQQAQAFRRQARNGRQPFQPVRAQVVLREVHAAPPASSRRLPLGM